jgi:ketosteroid isomerase-like protein
VAFAIGTVNDVAAQAEVAVDEEYAPLPEFRVFGEPATASDEAAIADLMRRFGEAWSSQDVDGAVEAYVQDAEWINAFADVYRGHEELRGQFARLFERFESAPDEADDEEEREASRPSMKRERLSLRYIGDDAAVIHSYTESDWGVNRDGEGLRRVHMTYVLEKQQDGKWLIAHQMIMDARR